MHGGYICTSSYVCMLQKTAESPAYLLSSVTVSDIDESRRGLEIVIASSTGRLYVIDSVTGRVLDNYPLSLPAAVHTQVTGRLYVVIVWSVCVVSVCGQYVVSMWSVYVCV